MNYYKDLIDKLKFEMGNLYDDDDYQAELYGEAADAIEELSCMINENMHDVGIAGMIRRDNDMATEKVYVVTHVNEDMRATASVFTNEEAAELYREYCESENRKSIEVGEAWPADTFTWQTENGIKRAGKPEEAKEQQEAGGYIQAIPRCKYYMPCGFCDRHGVACTALI